MKILTPILLSAVLVSAPLQYPSWINTPESLSQWLIAEFSYQDENGDYWKKPKETLKDIDEGKYDSVLKEE